MVDDSHGSVAAALGCLLPPEALDRLGKAGSHDIQLEQSNQSDSSHSKQPESGRGLEDFGDIVADDCVEPDMSMEREDEAQSEVDGHVVGRGRDHERSGSEGGQDDGALVIPLQHDLGAVNVEQVVESR